MREVSPITGFADNLPALDEADFFRLLMDQTRDIILLVRSDMTILYANQAASDAYGYGPGELPGMTVQDLRAPDAVSPLRDQLTAAFERGILFRSWHVRKNGERFPVEVNARKIGLPGLEAVISVVRDITGTVAMETALQQGEQKQQRLNEELTAANEELTAANEELIAANEGLTASEEDLRSQFTELMVKEAEIRRQNAILSSLQETALGLMQRRNPDDMLSAIVKDATRLVGTDHGFIYILDMARNVFRRTHGLGIYSRDIGREIPADQGIVGLVRRTGQPAIINDYPRWRSRNPLSVQFEDISAVLQIPLKSESQVVGTIGLAYCEAGRNFGGEELSTLSRFAELASIALDNSRILDSYRHENLERRTAQTSLKAMLDAIPDMMFVLGRDGTFLECKPGSDEFYHSPDFFIGKRVADLFPAELAELIMQKIGRAFATGVVQVFEYQLDISEKAAYFEARLVVRGDGMVLAICRNVTERRQMEEQLKHLSLHDALTGCYNRTFFEEEMRRFEKQRDSEVSLLMCDVDGLKIVNDSLGHGAGDEILRSVADILRISFRPGDIISRIGGDEFVVLLTTNSVKNCEGACERIKRFVADYNAAHPTLPISLSLGYAAGCHAPVDMNALFKEADNNMYREKLHQKNSARSAIVQGLVKALEVRDFITEGHGDRLQDLVERFARSLGLPEQNLPDLRLLAHFHDIGKVGIPDNILFKPGPLTAAEWSVMQKHCEIGHRIAMSTPDLAPIAKWILNHQEWWNGSGYPLGLREHSIPLECRILSIIDAFDAMTHDRPYRKALDPAAALDELRRCAGTQFDPQLVERFTRMLLFH